jgi:hypothetical protein
MVENCENYLSVCSLKGTGGSVSADHVAGAKYVQNFKKITGDNGYLSQQVLNLGGTGFKFKQWMEAVTAPYKAVYKGFWMKAKYSNSSFIRVFTLFSHHALVTSSLQLSNRSKNVIQIKSKTFRVFFLSRFLCLCFS